MSVKTSDSSQQVRDKVINRINLALRLIVEAIDREAEPITPKQFGDLRHNKLKQVLGTHATIIWKQEYAVYQEDKQHLHYTTAGTGPHFAEKAVRRVVENAHRYFKQAGVV